jgi:hypothetical protein
MVALVLADALLEKTGGDSLEEVRRHLEATLSMQAAWPPAPASTSSTISARGDSSPDSQDGRVRSPGGGSEP